MHIGPPKDGHRPIYTSPHPHQPRQASSDLHRAGATTPSGISTGFIVRAFVASVAAIAVALSIAAPAFGISLEEASRRVEETSAVYNEAVAEQERLAAEISDLEARITELEAQIPGMQAKAGVICVAMYKANNNRNDLMESVLGTSNLADAIRCFDTYNMVLDDQISQLVALADAKAELSASKEALASDKLAADAAVEEARAALDEAKRARQQAQAEAMAAKGGELAAQIDWSMSHDEFVEHWGARIDRYLSGTPLAGQGAVFADAAFQNGADPRWSPAISRIESGCGAHCFRLHNAWGWMGASFGSWSEGIYRHVRYLAGPLYGGYLTLGNARTYCPPTYQDWYNKVYHEMARM